MSINQKLLDRNQGQCELCNAELATIEYTVSPKNDDSIENQVAIGEKCSAAMDNKEASFHWRCLEGSIWNSEPSVQALSYRILFGLKEEVICTFCNDNSKSCRACDDSYERE